MNFYFTIYARGKIVGGDFGATAFEALDNYAAGSTYDRSELTAKRGVWR